MCSDVQDRARALGFGCFLTLLMLPADKALLMALAERWSPITQTFHLSVGEIGVPPINFFMMIELSVASTPPPNLEDFDRALVARCIGTQNVVYYKGTKGVLLSWFKKDYI